MKVYFLMTSRYPTNKAYGVTTGETARALRELGNEVKILSPSSSDSNYDYYKNEVQEIFSPVSSYLRKYLLNINGITKLIFFVTSMLLTFKSIELIRREKPDIIWARDYWAVCLLQILIPNSRFVVEVHQFPSFSNNLALAWFSRRHGIALLAIQESIREELIKRYPRANVFFGPMGASQSFFEVGKSRISSFSLRNERQLRVCYLGRMTSSGKENGIAQLLEDWKLIPGELAELTLIGLTQSESDQLISNCHINNVVFMPSLKHEDVPKALSNFDCGIIPYPEGTYHRTRFPIKLVEYCASGLNIIATDTASNNDLLSRTFGYFYSAGDTEELLKVLRVIKENTKDSQDRAKQGFEWAQGYTYQKRIRDIYPFLEGHVT